MKPNKIVAGNWKMNKSKKEVEEFISTISNISAPKCLTIISAPSVYLDYLVQHKPEWLQIAAQNVAKEENGAFTGEVSAEMLKSIGVNYSLVGHSERRQYYGETDAIVAEKIVRCLQNSIKPILCVGENLDEREANQTIKVVERQLAGAFKGLEDISNIVIAYEPVWAIGTGKTATSQQAEEVHKFIADWLENNFGANTNNPILYGGSCSPQNAEELFGMPHVSGGLIGGASLAPDSFAQLISIGDKF